MKKVKAIFKETTEKFNAKCLAEIFHMTKCSGTEYIRGTVLVECNIRKGIECYTVYRMDTTLVELQGAYDYYEIVLERTSDVDMVARELYKYSEYESLGWTVPYEKMINAWKEIA